MGFLPPAVSVSFPPFKLCLVSAALLTLSHVTVPSPSCFTQFAVGPAGGDGPHSSYPPRAAPHPNYRFARAPTCVFPHWGVPRRGRSCSALAAVFFSAPRTAFVK